MLIARFVAVLLLAGGSSAQAQPVNINAAKKEGKLIAYGTILPQVMGPRHAAFEKKYGVRVEYWRANATQVMERAMSEWQAGRPGFDVTLAINGAQALLKGAGVLAKFTPLSAEKFPASFKDKDGILTAWRHTPIGVLYNTEMIKGADASKNLDDLLLPKWKGKIILPDASPLPALRSFSRASKRSKAMAGWNM